MWTRTSMLWAHKVILALYSRASGTRDIRRKAILFVSTQHRKLTRRIDIARACGFATVGLKAANDIAAANCIRVLILDQLYVSRHSDIISERIL